MTVEDALRQFQIAVKLAMVFVFAFVVAAAFWTFAGCEAFMRPADDRYGDDLRCCMENDAAPKATHECLARAKQRYGGRR